VAVFSRRDHHLLRHPGLAWFRDVPWPMCQAVLDGEVCAETGMESIQGGRRGPRAGRPSRGVRRRPAPARGRGARCASDAAGGFLSWVRLLPRRPRSRIDGASTAVGSVDNLGRRGDRPQGSGRTPRTGPQSPAWLKHKQRLTLPVRVLDGSGEIVRWGDGRCP
jgi:hypothetical protein